MNRVVNEDDIPGNASPSLFSATTNQQTTITGPPNAPAVSSSSLFVRDQQNSTARNNKQRRAATAEGSRANKDNLNTNADPNTSSPTNRTQLYKSTRDYNQINTRNEDDLCDRLPLFYVKVKIFTKLVTIVHEVEVRSLEQVSDWLREKLADHNCEWQLLTSTNHSFTEEWFNKRVTSKRLPLIIHVRHAKQIYVDQLEDVLKSATANSRAYVDTENSKRVSVLKHMSSRIDFLENQLAELEQIMAFPPRYSSKGKSLWGFACINILLFCLFGSMIVLHTYRRINENEVEIKHIITQNVTDSIDLLRKNNVKILTNIEHALSEQEDEIIEESPVDAEWRWKQATDFQATLYRSHLNKTAFAIKGLEEDAKNFYYEVKDVGTVVQVPDFSFEEAEKEKKEMADKEAKKAAEEAAKDAEEGEKEKSNDEKKKREEAEHHHHHHSTGSTNDAKTPKLATKLPEQVAAAELVNVNVGQSISQSRAFSLVEDNSNSSRLETTISSPPNTNTTANLHKVKNAQNLITPPDDAIFQQLQDSEYQQTINDLKAKVQSLTDQLSDESDTSKALQDSKFAAEDELDDTKMNLSKLQSEEDKIKVYDAKKYSELEETQNKYSEKIKSLESDLKDANSHLSDSDNKNADLHQHLSDEQDKESKIQSDFKDLQNTEDQDSKKIDSLTSNLKHKTEKLSEEEKKSSGLTDKLSKSQQDLKSSKDAENQDTEKIDALNSDVQDKNSQLTDAQNTISNLNKQVSSIETNLSNLQSKEAQVAQQLHDAVSKNSENSKTIADQNRKIANLTSDIDDKSTTISNKETYIETLKNEITNFNNTVNTQKSQLSDNSNQIENLDNNVKDLDSQIIQQQTWLRDNNTLINQLNNTKNLLNSTVTADTETIKSQKAKISDDSQEIDADNKSIDDQKNKISDKDAEIKSLKDKINDDNNKIEEMKSEIEEDRQEIADYKNTTDVLSGEVGSNEIDIEDLQEKVESLNSTVSSKNIDIAADLATIDDLNNEVDEKNKLLARYNETSSAICYKPAAVEKNKMSN